MDNPYEVHSWSRLCREHALREARERHLLARAAGERRRCFGRDRAGAACRNALLVLFRRTKPAGAR